MQANKKNNVVLYVLSVKYQTNNKFPWPLSLNSAFGSPKRCSP